MWFKLKDLKIQSFKRKKIICTLIQNKLPLASAISVKLYVRDSKQYKI